MRLIRFEDTHGKVGMGEPIQGGGARLLRGHVFGEFEMTADVVEVRRLLAPVQPVNLLAIGLNYRRHAEESGQRIPDEPLVFAKLTTCVVAPGEPIVLPAAAPHEVDYEAELAVVIGRKARKVTEAEALSYVLGYTCANDVSARDCQVRRDKQWTRAKSFDTFCPLGPCLLIDPMVDPNALLIRGRLNGRLVQESNTSDMIFPVRRLISFLSQHFTLLPGTVIVTGTPEGVGFARRPPVFLRPGDTFTVEIEGIGELTNPVQADH